MMNKAQMVNLLGFGTMIALILITGLLFSPPSATSVSANTAPENRQVIVIDSETALQSGNAELRDAVLELQAREALYDAQIERALRVLKALEDEEEDD